MHVDTQEWINVPHPTMVQVWVLPNHLNTIYDFMIDVCILWRCLPSLTFSADLDGAGRPDPVAVFVPLPSHALQGNLTHEDGVLVLLDVKILQFLH